VELSQTFLSTDDITSRWQLPEKHIKPINNIPERGNSRTLFLF
jgi:hypothetical protein